jgi:hypothetical protein
MADSFDAAAEEPTHRFAVTMTCFLGSLILINCLALAGQGTSSRS